MSADQQAGSFLDHSVSHDSSDYDSCNSDIDDDSDAEVNEDYYSYIDNDFETSEVDIHPLLEHDFDMVREKYGAHSVMIRTYGVTDDVDIELSISMTFLDPDIADAWKIKRSEPLIIRLHMNASQYLDAIEPKVEVFQPSQKEKFGVGSQMRQILDLFIREQWKGLHNEDVAAKQDPSAVTQAGSQKRRKFWSQLSNPEAKEKEHCPSPDALVFSDASVAKMTGMGFSVNMVQNALTITRGNEEDAINLILSNPDCCKSSAIATKGPAPSPPYAQGSSVDPSPTCPKRPPRVKSQNSYPKTTGPKAPSSRRFRQLPSWFGGEKKDGSSGDVMKVKNPKQIPGLELGFLVMVIQYSLQRIGTLNEFCVVCDKRHVFTTSAMLKPAVCARELCIFSFQTLGVMSDAADDIATGSEVVDLLIAMARAACKSKRRDIIFDPFPTVINPGLPKMMAFDPKNPNFQRAERTVDSFPPMRRMLDLVVADLKKVMDETDTLSYPLLQWIITSNRSHIVKLPKEKQLSFMRTSHQYLLFSAPPAQEATFQEAKKRHGSTFAFHGSNIENWHSIMRMGLLVASGTKRQVHGSAYGTGIYLSPHSNVSFGYSLMGSRYQKQQPAKLSTERFLKSSYLTCIALCEVVTNSDLRKHGSIWVMANSDLVCTRFFFVYEDGCYGDETIDTQGPGYNKEILTALSYRTQ